MTVVIGINWYTEMLILADTRVSWTDESRLPEDILRKLYILGDHRKTAVLGFSGQIAAAQTIMKYLIEMKFQHMRRRFVIDRLKDDLRTWIEEVSIQKISPKDRSSLSFILCGLEPYRPPFFGKNSEKMLSSHFLNREVHLYVYKIHADSGRVSINKHQDVAIIGSGKEMRNEILGELNKTIGFGFQQSNLHWARALITTQRIAELFKQSEYDMSVGGPFQTIRLTPERAEERYTWPPDLDYYDVQVTKDKDVTTIYNPRQEKTYMLYPLWNLPPSLRGKT